MENENKDSSVVVEHTVVNAPEKKKDRFLPISILVAAVVIGGALVFTSLYKGGAGGAAAPSGANGGNGQAAAPTVDVTKLTPRDVILGSANAPVTVIEYGDYQCPFCGIWFSQVQPKLVSDYLTPGKVKLVFRDFPFLGPESNTAGAAVECALDQGKFWAYHDALYTAEVADGHENSGNLTSTLYISLAKNLGMDTAAFSSCISSGKYTTAVNDQETQGQAAGVNSTPTTFVNGKMVTDSTGNSAGANSALIFAAVDAALK